VSAALEPARPLASPRAIGGTRWLVPGALLAGLAAMVAARWGATRLGMDPLAVGAGFGLALAVLAIGGASFDARARSRLRESATDRGRRAAFAAAIGIAFGLVLVGMVTIGGAIAGAQLVPGLGRPAADFAPWVAITILVASAEEALLRGRLFDALRRAAGALPSVAITTTAFALMHVPLYGWHVVPLDLAVGLAFAGLRLATGSVVAPAAAHSTADLATWWL
jgi:membrane protease YdiL (CAAX protease family)